jgi:UDP:flavonoid glycosyltransferase YjiC (YdhE family)
LLSKVSGYFYLPTPDTYSPHPALLDFLNSGRPPVYIGFGSIIVDDPTTLTNIVLEAIKIAGVRAIISRGWGQLGHDTALPGTMPSSFNSQDPDIFFLSSCPHQWLFPRVSCVVHHGGAGTTAAGLAAGKPTVVVPFFGDQPFWGNMIHRCGVGPQPIPSKHLTAETLAAAILFATTDETVQRYAVGLREQISSENGLKNAVDHFHRCLPDSVFTNLDAGASRPLNVRRYTKRKGKRNIDVELSAVAATVLRKEKLIDWSELKLYAFPSPSSAEAHLKLTNFQISPS